MSRQEPAEDRLKQIEAYLDNLESPKTLEFENEEVRRVVRVIARKVRSLATGEPELKDELPPQVQSLLETWRRVGFRGWDAD